VIITRISGEPLDVSSNAESSLRSLTDTGLALRRKSAIASRPVTPWTTISACVLRGPIAVSGPAGLRGEKQDTCSRSLTLFDGAGLLRFAQMLVNGGMLDG